MLFNYCTDMAVRERDVHKHTHDKVILYPINFIRNLLDAPLLVNWFIVAQILSTLLFLFHRRRRLRPTCEIIPLECSGKFILWFFFGAQNF